MRFFDRFRFLSVLLISATLSCLDLVLLERKYGVFSGGFLQAHRIVGAWARTEFVATIFVAELLLAGIVINAFCLSKRFVGLPRRFQFVIFSIAYGGGSALTLIAKYQVISYFGDLVSMAVLRNLGGGSLSAAIAYTANEWKVSAAVSVVVILLFVLWLRNILVRYSVPHLGFRRSTHVTKIFVLAAVLVVHSAFARGDRAIKFYANKITPIELVNAGLNNSVFSQNSYKSQLLDFVSSAPRTEWLTPSIVFPDHPQNLVFVVVESARADCIDDLENKRSLTPNWRDMANAGVLSQQYYSHSGFTTSSLKALFRGGLGERLPLGGTLFEILKQQGYQVVSVSGQDESFGGISSETGGKLNSDYYFDAGLSKDERVFSSAAPGSLAVSNKKVVDEFARAFELLDRKRPFFAYVNLQSAHFPYFHLGMPKNITRDPLPRDEISEENRDRLIETYLNAVSYSDWATGQILKRLKAMGVYDNTIVVIAGDHGESLFDEGTLGHGIKISDFQTRALLVANRKLPALSRLLGQKDLAQAMLEGLGARVSLGFQTRHDAVLQYIGDIRSPSSLGYVYGDGSRLTIDFDNQELAATWLDRSVEMGDLKSDSRERLELSRLLAEWRDVLEN